MHEFSQQSKFTNEHSATSFLMLLILGDLAFIAIHVLYETTSIDFLGSVLFSISRDFGYAEIYQYVKEFWVVLLTLLVFSKTKEIGYISWTMLFTYLLFDDSLQIHERAGSIVAARLDLAPAIGLRAQDFGELAVSAISAVSLLTLIGIFYLRGSAIFKKTSRDLFLILSAIAFFGVLVDMVDVAIHLGPIVEMILVTMEDGGEMIATSVLTWYVFLLNNYNGHANISLRNSIFGAFTKRPNPLSAPA